MWIQNKTNAVVPASSPRQPTGSIITPLPQALEQTTLSRHKWGERLKIEFSGFAWRQGIPKSYSWGHVFPHVDWICLNISQVVEKEDPNADGNNNNKNHKDYKNSQIHLKHNQQGETNRIKRCEQRRDSCEPMSVASKQSAWNFVCPETQLTLFRENRFAWTMLLNIWTFSKGDSIPLSLAPQASLIFPGGIDQPGEPSLWGITQFKLHLFCILGWVPSLISTFLELLVCRKLCKTCLGWIQEKWEITSRYL